MEDAATAEISRTSIWQWIKNRNILSNGKVVDEELFKLCLEEEIENVKKEIGDDSFHLGKFERAKSIFEDITLSDDIDEFLTLKAYEEL